MRVPTSISRSTALLAVTILLTFGCQTENTPSGIEGNEMERLSFQEIQQPSVTIQKLTNGMDADSQPGPSIPPGTPVVWEYVVTNTGDEPLDNVAVLDDHEGPASCPKSSLEPGESMTCSILGLAVPGQYENHGTVLAYSPQGDSVTASDPSHYYGGSVPPVPVLDIEKATNGHDADLPPGPTISGNQTVQWSYVVTNMGNVPLSNIVVTDDQGVAVSCPQSDLAPGESMTCTGYGNSQLGQYANIGTATGTTPEGDVVIDEDPSHYFGEPDSILDVLDIDIEKSTNGHDADVAPGPVLDPGAPVAWTYVVTNTSTSATLTNVTVTDDQGVAVLCPQTTLGAGESMACTANGVAQLGQYANVGTVTAEWFDGNFTITLTDADPSHYYGEISEQTGDQGCSHGYWKNHIEMWEAAGAAPQTGLLSVFSAAAGLSGFENYTLMDALNFKGGKDLDGAARILLRQAAAAWLNARHPGVAYPRLSTDIVADANTAIANGDRYLMLELAEELDADNNRGCSL